MKTNILFVILAWLLACQTFAQSELVKELNQNIIEVKTISPDSSFYDLSNLENNLIGKSIIGLGEATHGTHEFFVYKHRLLKYLVIEEEFRVFIIEGDFVGSQVMYDYVVHGEGTINDGLMGIGYGIWFRQEFVELIEWMKEYNIDKPLQDKIKFYGCDIVSGRMAAKEVMEYLTRAGKLSADLKDGLDWLVSQKYRKKLNNDDREFINQFQINFRETLKGLEYENSRSEFFMQRCQREIEQFLEYVFADRRTQIVLRDKFMAENIELIFNYENAQKSIFWAHNEHVKNDKTDSDQKPTGYYLKQNYNNDYFSFGFGFHSGSVSGFNQEENSFDSFDVPAMSVKKLTDAVFNECIYPNFILDFKSVSENIIITKFLHDNMYQRTIGAGYYPDGAKRNHFRYGRLIDKYDGLIFIRNTSPSTLIE